MVFSTGTAFLHTSPPKPLPSSQRQRPYPRADIISDNEASCNHLVQMGWAHSVFHYWHVCFPEYSLSLYFCNLLHASVQTASPALPSVLSPATQLAVYHCSYWFEELIWPPSPYSEGSLSVNGSVTKTEMTTEGHPHTCEETRQGLMAQKKHSRQHHRSSCKEDCQINVTQTGIVLANNSKRTW